MASSEIIWQLMSFFKVIQPKDIRRRRIFEGKQSCEEIEVGLGYRILELVKLTGVDRSPDFGEVHGDYELHPKAEGNDCTGPELTTQSISASFEWRGGPTFRALQSAQVEFGIVIKIEN